MTTTAAPAWFTAALDSLLAGNVDGFMKMYADDAVHEFPFAPEGAPARLEGKATIAAYMSKLPSVVKYDALDVQVREAGDELIVEASARGTRPGTGAAFHMQYVWFITHRDGLVSRFRDYMNPRPRSPTS